MRMVEVLLLVRAGHIEHHGVRALRGRIDANSEDFGSPSFEPSIADHRLTARRARPKAPAMLRPLHSATRPSPMGRLSLVSESPATSTGPLRDKEALRLLSLENTRSLLVQTVFEALAACQKKNTSVTQLLLSAAVRDLDDMDRMLFELRHDIAARLLQPATPAPFNSRLRPTDPFPEDLHGLSDRALHVLNSKLHRQLDTEYLQGGPQLETEIRSEEINLELDERI